MLQKYRKMKHTILGNSHLSISSIGLGCMGMSEFYGPTNDPESVATIHAALDAGLNFLDTSDIYGPFTNEVLVGNTIRDRRDEVVLATKFGIVRSASDPTVRGFNSSPAYVRAACEASLKRLGLDVIDLYYQHRVDPKTPIEETVGEMSRLVEEGKVRFLGLSEASAATIRRAAAVHSISAVQSEYSLWSRDIEADIVPVCAELGITLVAYSPLGRGFLTGQIKSIDDFAADDFRRSTPRFQGDNFAKNLELVEKIKQLAVEKGCTASQLALAWCMAQGQHIVPIVGTKRRSYLQENLGALNVELTQTDLETIAALFPQEAVAGERYAAAGMKFING